MKHKYPYIQSEAIMSMFSNYYHALDKEPHDQAGVSQRQRALAFYIQTLKEFSGQDFGEDISEYVVWFETHAEDWWKYSKIPYNPDAYKI